MDKLEFDLRIARLEHKVSRLTVLLVLIVIAAGVGLGLESIRSMRRGSTTVMVGSVRDEVRSETVRAAESRPAIRAGTMAHLDAELRKLWSLQLKGLIQPADYEAKKKAILEEPLQVGDVADDMQMARQLSNGGLLKSPEYDILKAKILQLK